MEDQDKLIALATRDPVVAIMWGAMFLLFMFNLYGFIIAARFHEFGVVKVSLSVTLVFAVAGIVFGLVRSLRAKQSV